MTHAEAVAALEKAMDAYHDLASRVTADTLAENKSKMDELRANVIAAQAGLTLVEDEMKRKKP